MGFYLGLYDCTDGVELANEEESRSTPYYHFQGFPHAFF